MPMPQTNMKTMDRKKHFKISALFLPLVALGFSIAASSCSAFTEIKGIRMSSTDPVDVYYGNFSYEGIGVTVDYVDGSSTEIPLTEEMVSEVERLKFFKMGAQTIDVVYKNRFKTTMDINVLLNQFKDSYALNGYECTYDGQPHIVTLNQELPEGASIVYPYGNVFTNAGRYEITGVISKNGYESKTLSTVLTIHQATHSTDEMVFEDATVIYNGEMRSIEVQNVPEGVEVTYETFPFGQTIPINKVVNAGKYRVVAHFTDTSPNYQKIPDKEAILTIEKAYYDVSGVHFPNVTRTWDNQDYEAKVSITSPLPTGIQIAYAYYDEDGNKVNSNSKVGTYTMEASFVGGDTVNYHPIEPLRATLKVVQKVISIRDKITFESESLDFDRQEHSLAIKGTLPSGVKVDYVNNGHTYAGEYEIKAVFTAENPNETVDVSEMTAYMIINRIRDSVKVKSDPASSTYDQDFASANIVIENGEATVVGYDESVFRVASISFLSLMNNEPVAVEDLKPGTTYKYVVVFEYLDENLNNSIILSQESDIFEYVGSVAP